VRLCCLGHAGSDASAFYPWARELPADVDLCVVQLPGRENRLGEPALTRMGPLVDGLARAMSPLLGVPYALFGHSMGATVGFELARALRRKGAPGPVRLFTAGRRAPARSPCCTRPTTAR
jgi:surfactin synthase thioesterase subunit